MDDPTPPRSTSLLRWIDVIPHDKVREIVPWDIAKPPQEDFEVRVIVWKAKKVEGEASLQDRSN